MIPGTFLKGSMASSSEQFIRHWMSPLWEKQAVPRYRLSPSYSYFSAYAHVERLTFLPHCLVGSVRIQKHTCKYLPHLCGYQSMEQVVRTGGEDYNQGCTVSMSGYKVVLIDVLVLHITSTWAINRDPARQ
jgi:hypothetical protein